MRILVLEDNRKLSALLVSLLDAEAYAVDPALTIADAEAALAVATYDLIVLDLSLPDGDGGTVLRALRKRGNVVRVLVTSARTEITDRVRTLDQGADDYLPKPFSPEELLARVRALLRRPHEAQMPVIQAGNVALDTGCSQVTIAGSVVAMPPREISVLQMLLRHHGKLVSRRVLENAIYAFDIDVTPNAVDAAISRVRRRLETHGASVTVTTMRGLGYVLVDAPA